MDCDKELKIPGILNHSIAFLRDETKKLLFIVTKQEISKMEVSRTVVCLHFCWGAVSSMLLSVLHGCLILVVWCLTKIMMTMIMIVIIIRLFYFVFKYLIYIIIIIILRFFKFILYSGSYHENITHNFTNHAYSICMCEVFKTRTDMITVNFW